VISFEVSSAYALTKDTINAVAFTEYSGNYIFSNIPESALTQITAKSMQINYMVPDVLPKGTVVNFTFYVQDSFGNASQECMKVSVAQPADEGTPGWNPPVPAGSKTGQGVLVPDKNTWDPGTDPTLGATLQLLPGTSVQEFQVVVVDFKGTVVYTKKFTYGANNFTAHQVATPNGYVTKINFNFLSNEFAPVLSTGVYLVKIFNLQDNKEIARNYMVLGPKALRPRY
jgi:hypothetical protein